MKTKATVQEEQKTNVINWDVPQLVIAITNGHIVQTSGKHRGSVFSGMTVQIGETVNDLFNTSDDFDKSVFTPFYGSITLTNINE